MNAIAQESLVHSTMSTEVHHEMTFVDICEERSRALQNEPYLTFLDSRGEPESTLTFCGLDANARRLASSFFDADDHQQRVVLLLPWGSDFVRAFYACLYAGAVAVPLGVPTRRDDSWSRFIAILRSAHPRKILTSQRIFSRLGQDLETACDDLGVEMIVLEDLSRCDVIDFEPSVCASDLAFLQYTSGSTSSPKGVMVTHGNLVAHGKNLLPYLQANETVVGWLPMFHDMGLIGTVLQPMYVGAHAVLMSPDTFMRTPALWLKSISRYRAAVSAAPNFAYDHCVERVAEADLEGLDLISWRVALNGSEFVHAETLERFHKRFACVGFNASTHAPCYGLAEAVLFVAGAGFEAPVIKSLSASDDGQAYTRHLVCVGVSSGLDIRIVDPETKLPCAAGAEGEIWVSGESIAMGYWNQAELTEQTFGARIIGETSRFMRTGDLGILEGGRLFVTGRLKEQIIIRGRNYAPEDIERLVQSAHPALQENACAAFSIMERSGERLALVQEIARSHLRKVDFRAVCSAIKAAIFDQLSIGVSEIVLLSPARLQKTSSGKIRRLACRDALVAGGLDCLFHWREKPAYKHGKVAAVAGSQYSLPESSEEIHEWVCNWMTQMISNYTHVDPADIAYDVLFADLGMDSSLAVSLTGELAKITGLELEPTMFWEHPSVDQIADAIAGMLEESGAQNAA